MKSFQKHTSEQIVAKLDKARSMKDSGSTVAEVCRDLGVSEASYHHWVKQYGEMSRSETRRFTELQEQNAKLKRLLREAEREKVLLKDLVKAKILTPARRYEAIDYALSVGCSVRFACRVAGVSTSGVLQRFAHATINPTRISTPLCAGGSSPLLVSTDAGVIATLGRKPDRPALPVAVMWCIICGTRRVCGSLLAKLLSDGACCVPTPRTHPVGCPGHVWALDFQCDSDYQGKAF
ncbi:transposase [Corynebacterium pseudodiphtheriticum]|uniref:transposase n=1 Tax=Corynebacterium pseudodiphtheriticum TaxID=37637 RepID=UPI00254E8BC0|nr:transposase [Corynebacterium pseudodiphtheriticum]MDK8701079.1 transposase [Corynebacterium pseudodiphtheriticum]MDK8775708.1 transposase [Corynebacterium pseudodiphtheriticum]